MLNWLTEHADEGFGTLQLTKPSVLYLLIAASGAVTAILRAWLLRAPPIFSIQPKGHALISLCQSTALVGLRLHCLAFSCDGICRHARSARYGPA